MKVVSTLSYSDGNSNHQFLCQNFLDPASFWEMSTLLLPQLTLKNLHQIAFVFARIFGTFRSCDISIYMNEGAELSTRCCRQFVLCWSSAYILVWRSRPFARRSVLRQTTYIHASVFFFRESRLLFLLWVFFVVGKACSWPHAGPSAGLKPSAHNHVEAMLQ